MKGPGQDSRSRDTHGPYSESNNVCITHSDHTEGDALDGHAARNNHTESAGWHTLTGGKWLVERSERRISNHSHQTTAETARITKVVELSVMRRHAMCGGATYPYSLHLHSLLTRGNWTPDPRTFCLGLHGHIDSNHYAYHEREHRLWTRRVHGVMLTKGPESSRRENTSEAPTAEPLQKF